MYDMRCRDGCIGRNVRIKCMARRLGWIIFSVISLLLFTLTVGPSLVNSPLHNHSMSVVLMHVPFTFPT